MRGEDVYNVNDIYWSVGTGAVFRTTDSGTTGTASFSNITPVNGRTLATEAASIFRYSQDASTDVPDYNQFYNPYKFIGDLWWVLDIDSDIEALFEITFHYQLTNASNQLNNSYRGKFNMFIECLIGSAQPETSAGNSMYGLVTTRLAPTSSLGTMNQFTQRNLTNYFHGYQWGTPSFTLSHDIDINKNRSGKYIYIRAFMQTGSSLSGGATKFRVFKPTITFQAKTKNTAT